MSRRPLYHLANGEALNAANPTTFLIPSLSDRTSLVVGDIAKMTFSCQGCELSERMWVIVTKLNRDGSYVGTLDNDPMQLPLKWKMRVDFEPRHVINIDRSLHPKPKLALVPKLVLQ